MTTTITTTNLTLYDLKEYLTSQKFKIEPLYEKENLCTWYA